MTTYETALNEFRDASAAVRRAFGAVAEAREMQIIADSQHKQASQAHADAAARLDRADAALTAARAAAPEPAAPVVAMTSVPAGVFGLRFNEQFNGDDSSTNEPA